LTIKAKPNIEKMKMGFIKKQRFFRVSFLLPAFVFLTCSSTDKQPDKKILAQIGEKQISVEEFLQRSELTLRPDDYKDKNITLNNLIYEKILAIEAESNNEYLNNPAFQGKLKGIQEQMMRDKLYDEVAFNKVKLDSSEVKKAYRLSIREYELEFYAIQNRQLAQRIETIIDSVPEGKNEILKKLEKSLGKKPLHKVNYLDQDDDAIHESIFTNLLDTGTVVGPIRLENGDYILMKVLKWVDYPLISGLDQRVRWNKVKEKLHKMKAKKLWRTYTANLMKGKKIEFEKQTFEELSDWALEYHLINKDSLNNQISEIPVTKPQIDLNAPFFTIDNKLWTVDDFKKELMSHPLVYRTKYLNRNNFAEQFKFAVVDMVRDHYLTQEAYKRSLDNSEEINKTVQMWSDAYLANKQKNNIINSALQQGLIDEKDNTKRLKYWESYLKNLSNKYSNEIWINHEEYDKILLTNIDYFAIRPGVPYPIAVPVFPKLISSQNLGYVKNNVERN
jgi:hypothetical protein